ncbi:thiopurine S-methyltransferase [Thiomicrorhabdus aquaedulcis]|uniref:thiopurine S-methyltransferase n=1 Tax=Thiomicrorhabdus aquaedulcis TaxID=2211106 RepID=UPI000FD8D0B7|nr:thiopurine S-methyltransferase [Thiomicrorhabdus aquaedulcis]
MDADFWHKMWQSGVVGFHQADINAFLRQFWPRLMLNGGAVLVPLCGKSLDMLWLKEAGHEVLGVELSAQALDEFLHENNIVAQPITHDRYCGYELPGMRLLCGDFFHLTAQECRHVCAVYDRAAIVALPKAMRAAYAQHLKVILPKGTQLLMVTMEYNETQLSGPPFSVTQDEVMELFAGFMHIEKVAQSTSTRRGVAVTELVFLMQS